MNVTTIELLRTAWSRGMPRSTSCRRSPSSPRRRAARPTSTPIYQYQGVANNEAETSLFADVARTEFNVTGTGVTVGVISDSVSQYNGRPVRVLQDRRPQLHASRSMSSTTDRPVAPTKAARCWRISTTSPRAPAWPSTRPAPSDLAVSQAVTALATTGKSNIIADDVSFADEPIFQDGVIAQAIDTVDRAAA